MNNLAKFLIFNFTFLIALTSCDNIFRDPKAYSGRPSNMSYSQAPSITDLNVSAVTYNSALIGWKTDKPANSEVYYGETQALGNESINSANVLDHSVTLAGLKTSTKYYYIVKSRDSLGNIVITAQSDFTTGSSGTGGKPDSTSLTVVHFTLGTWTGMQPQEAVWIEDASGNFIRTLFISNYSSNNKTTLSTWYSKSSGQTNGTAGASKSTGINDVPWQCINNSGSIVTPGDYRFCIETRQESGTGPDVYSGFINLGNTATNATGTNGSYLTSLSAYYAP